MKEKNFDFERKYMSLGIAERSNCVKGTGAYLRSEFKSPHMTSDLFDYITLCSNFIGAQKLTHIITLM